MNNDKDILEQLHSIKKILNHTTERPLPLKEAARYLDLSTSYLYKLTSTGRIAHYKPGKKVYFEKSDLDQWLLQNRVPTREETGKKASSYVLKNRRSR